MEPDGTLTRMKQDWNERARKDAEFFIAKTTGAEAFEASARDDVRALVSGIESAITPSARILEMGCGIGRLIKQLAPQVREIHGIDVSGEMIERAGVYLADLPNVHLHENTGSDLSDLETGSFDVVYSYLMFQHVPDQTVVERYLHEASRVLRPSGVFKFQIDGRGDRPLWRAYRSIRGHSSWRGALWTRSGIKAAVRRAGFDVIDCEVDPRKRGAMKHAYLWVTCVKAS